MPVKYDAIKCPRDMGEAINDAINMAFTELRKEHIPIEWIKRYASKKSGDDDCYWQCYWQYWEEDVLKMIDDWEKSKDARRQD